MATLVERLSRFVTGREQSLSHFTAIPQLTFQCTKDTSIQPELNPSAVPYQLYAIYLTAQNLSVII